VNRAGHLLALAIAAATAWGPTPARACSFAGPTAHVVDPSLQATDQTPPTFPAPISYEVRRGIQSSGGCSHSSCEGTGEIYLSADATDDATPPERIGYRLSREAGTLPSGLILPHGAIEPGLSGPRLFLLWDSGARDGDEPIDFTLRVVAIDLAGNESAPQLVRVQDDPPGGCGIARRRASGSGRAALVVAALLLLVAHRRRRRTRPPGQDVLQSPVHEPAVLARGRGNRRGRRVRSN